MNKLRREAEKLRAAGYSYNLIHKKLGIAKGTMSYWFKDKPFTPNHEVLERIKKGPLISGVNRHNQRVKDIKNIREQAGKELGILTRRDLWMLGLGIYIGEGSKSIESVRIANSDPLIIKFVLRWLKEVCMLEDSNIRLSLHVYPDTNIDKCMKYWRVETGLKHSNFYKVIIDKRVDKKRSKLGKLPYGTAHLRVVSNGDPSKGVSLYRKIEGWMLAAINQV